MARERREGVGRERRRRKQPCMYLHMLKRLGNIFRELGFFTVL